MKVAFVSWRELADPQWGGSEVLVDRVASGFVERDWEVSLLCAGPVSERQYSVRANGGRFDQYLRAPFAGRSVRAADVVIDVSNGIPFFTPLWTRTKAICLVHHIHGDQWNDVFPAPIARVGWFLEGRVAPRVYRRFLSVSPSTTAGLLGLGVNKSKIKELRNGVDVDTDPPESSGRSTTPLFTVISRLVPHKGVDRVLDAWAEVGPHVGGELVIVGDGPLRVALEARQTPRTTFVGRVDEATKVDILRRSWLLIHGAHHEGWGLVVVEAAAVGVPTLAFAVAGVRDSVVHGETGLLVHDTRALIERWTALAEHHEERERMGRRAWERATTLSWTAAEALAAEAVEATAAGTW